MPSENKEAATEVAGPRRPDRQMGRQAVRLQTLLEDLPINQEVATSVVESVL